MARIGPYELLERIGVGGMAEVFKARQVGEEGFERLVAVKRILPNIAADPDFVRMFIDEAKIAVQLQHPNIAQIYDLGRDVDELFIALEYIEGRDMKGIGVRQKQMGRHLPLSFVIRVVCKVCEALNHAHFARGATGEPLLFVHRDISPQNILISHEGAVKVIDFGLAKATGRLVTTQAGVVKGKLAYLSAEQARGDSIDYRSDIFSLGTCLYEWLTGERLFLRKSDADTVIAVQRAMVPPLRAIRPELPTALQTIVRRALQPHPGQRYQTAAELQEALMTFAVDAGIPIRRQNISAHMMLLFPEDQSGPPAKVARRETIRSSGRRAAPRSQEVQSLLDLVPTHPKSTHPHAQGPDTRGFGEEATRALGLGSVEEELSIVDIIEEGPDVVAVPVVEHDSSAQQLPPSAASWDDDETRAVVPSELHFGDDSSTLLVDHEGGEPTRAAFSSGLREPAKFDDRTTGNHSLRAAELVRRPGAGGFDTSDEHTVAYTEEVMREYLGESAADDATLQEPRQGEFADLPRGSTDATPREPEPLQRSFSSLQFVDETSEEDVEEVFSDPPSLDDDFDDQTVIGTAASFEQAPIPGDATQPSVAIPAFPDDESG